MSCSRGWRPVAEGADKRLLRRRLRAARRGIGDAAREAAARHVASTVARLARALPTGVAGVYAASRSEIDVAGACDALDRLGWRLAFPRVVDPEPSLVFHTASRSELTPGYRGILEPPLEAPVVDVAAMDLILVPGVGFDRLGHRLGQGGGFYDRVLAADGRPPAWGVAFAAQVLPALPIEPWDRPVDVVVTERGHAVDGRWTLR